MHGKNQVLQSGIESEPSTNGGLKGLVGTVHAMALRSPEQMPNAYPPVPSTLGAKMMSGESEAT